MSSMIYCSTDNKLQARNCSSHHILHDNYKTLTLSCELTPTDLIEVNLYFKSQGCRVIDTEVRYISEINLSASNPDL